MRSDKKTELERAAFPPAVLACYTLLSLCILLVVICGCGRRAREAPAGVRPDTSDVNLPPWAPAEPSEALLRAARVLKPLPEDVMPYSPLLLASYELFGSLTDEQIETFKERKQVRLPLGSVPGDARDIFREQYGAQEIGGEMVYDSHEVVIPFPSLSPAQREAFDKVVEAWRETFAGRPDRADLLVRLYEIGARKDLSNLGVVFRARGHAVGLQFQVPAGRGVSTLGASDFAQL